MTSSDAAVSLPSSATDDTPRYRSGAVARMARMPVATLRVWERRYRVTMPAVTESGQRLYSAADVHRLALIRQLTDLGHAIGALAALDLPQLQAVARTHFSAGSAATGPGHDDTPLPPTGRPWQLAVVGPALARRLQHPALLRQLGIGADVAGPFDTLALAALAIADAPVDAVLVHAPTLHPGWLAEFDAAAPGLRALPVAVLYGLGADSVCMELAAAGVRLLREPQNDTVLGQWLRGLARPASAPGALPAPAAPMTAAAPQRRWGDATLSELASMSTTIACECPRHVAELLLQLTRFEAYSAECENRNAADAALHAYLGQVAGAARALFETALERVAAAEGLPLPPA
ncbi:MerR family transcriptional regulator [Comamonadaceae bacterium G21597-S1]|nr:MerR family transcriptional regulator [Comamonadaceae bacterium G21597-S1]